MARWILVCAAILVLGIVLMTTLVYNNETPRASLVGMTTTAPPAAVAKTFSVPSSSGSKWSLGDKSWRQTNRLVVEYRPDIASRVTELVSRQAVASDPDVVRLAADVIDGVPPTAAIGVKRSREIEKTPQAESVNKLMRGKRGGFFIECGALDGERASNTIWLEKELGWTGLLIEMDPFFYTQLLGKNRRVFSVNACLSPHKYITALPYRGSESGHGRLLYQQGKEHQAVATDTFVPCFPLESLLAAINRTQIDYLSLDVEGAEMDVLNTIPWDKLNIDILSVEYLHAPKGKKTYSDFMESVGYKVYADIHLHKPDQTFYADDYIFVKKTLGIA